MSMILAVLARRAGVRTATKEVYVSTVGGARSADPAADLAIAVAVASAAGDAEFARPVVALGEVGLSGDVRRVPGVDRRLAEAARLGFEVALVPVGSVDRHPVGMKVVEVATVAQALTLLGVRFRRRQADGERPQLAVVGR